MSKSIKKKKVPFIYKLISIILGIISILLILSFIKLNVLNIPLLLLVISIILIFVYIGIFLLLKSKIKKTGFSISLILILVFSIITFYISKTTGLLNNLNLSYKTYNYSVVVLKSNNYNKLNDIKDLDVGYYNDGSSENTKALNKVLKKVNVDSLGYEDTTTLANSLLNNEIDAMLIENSFLEILELNLGLNEYVDDIYNFTVITNTSDISKDIDVIKEPFNIYLSGIDTFGEISSVSRSDVNMVVSINPSTRKILLTSIPRDYYVKLHGKSGYKDKLTHASLYGTDMSIKTIEDLLDIEINYYVKVNFSSVIDIVDALGGIEVYSDYDFTSRDEYRYKEGYNKVNGEEALSFARERKAFLAGDRQRVKNQQAVFEAIVNKCISKKIITKYSKLLDTLHGSFITNMPTARITSLIRFQISKNYSWDIASNSLEGSDSSNYTYSAPNQKAYVMLPDEESVMNAKKLINEVSSNDNKSITVDKTADNKEDVLVTDNKFKVKLVRSSVTLTKGEEYIYHGITATYGGKDITGSDDIITSFNINNKEFDDYRELVRYVTYNLECGNYVITYNISYKGSTKTLKQKVTINE